MAANSETGHAKNVANLSTLTSVVKGFGEVYNPSKQSITHAALATLAGNANKLLKMVNIALGIYSVATAARDVGFKPLSKLATRILNAIRASDTTEQIDDTVQSLVRKIQGKRATPRKTEEEKVALQAEGIVVKEVSSSQMSFDNRLDSLDKLIGLLSNIPQYAPNEEDLKLTTLSTDYTNLKSLNTAVVEAGTRLSNARRARNEMFYTPDLGMVDTALAAKAYIKSLFGATSQQYKQVSGLAFKVIKL